LESDESKNDVTSIESCNSVWLFDVKAMEFKRKIRNTSGEADTVSTDWRPYFGLEVDESNKSFVVQLNESGTRLLKSWIHKNPCNRCSDSNTTEISLEEINKALEP
jgi:hypothetical protein